MEIVITAGNVVSKINFTEFIFTKYNFSKCLRLEKNVYINKHFNFSNVVFHSIKYFYKILFPLHILTKFIFTFKYLNLILNFILEILLSCKVTILSRYFNFIHKMLFFSVFTSL